MLNNLFKKKDLGNDSNNFDNERPNIPDGMWVKCDNCGSILYNEDLKSNSYVCPKCKYHFKITAHKRIDLFFDKGSFKEINSKCTELDPLNFKGYAEKIEKCKKKTDSSEAVITGVGKVNGIKVAAGIMDSFFMMGSMGTVVGERLTSLIEYAIDKRLPLIIFTTSGGARMQEGIFSLMQMAKVSAAIAKFDDAGLLYITVLTNPTTGGVTASFAMEGDIILSEPDALVGFAGRRVIENTIKETLPDNFQKAEFLLKKGFVDDIVDRRELRKEIYTILKLHEVNKYE